MAFSNHMKTSRISTVAVAVVAVLSLAACETSSMSAAQGVSSSRLPASVKFPIQVVNEKDGITIVVKPHVFALSQDDKGRVAWLAETYKHVGHGDIWVVAPTGSANSAASIGAAAEIAKVMVDQGVKPTSIRMNSYQAAAADEEAPITVLYKRYNAYTAECGRWDSNVALTPMNGTSKNFGCTTQANLAAMVADPHDLIAPRDIDPADPARRTAVFGKYREGVSTSTERSSDESGIVSDVVN